MKKKSKKKIQSNRRVPRPSHKKPRPKKYVEPKLPNTDYIPEAINANPTEQYIDGKLIQPRLVEALDELVEETAAGVIMQEKFPTENVKIAELTTWQKIIQWWNK